MRPRDRRLLYLFLALAALGVLHLLITRPATMILPALVLGTIFVLYKFPPGRWRRRGPRQRQPGPRSSSKYATRTGGSAGKRGSRVKLRVIRGNKKDGPPPPIEAQGRH